MSSGCSWLERQDDSTFYSKLMKKNKYNFIFKYMNSLIVYSNIIIIGTYEHAFIFDILFLEGTNVF